MAATTVRAKMLTMRRRLGANPRKVEKESSIAVVVGVDSGSGSSGSSSSSTVQEASRFPWTD